MGNKQLKLAIIGAGGRMGQLLCQSVLDHGHILAGAVVRTTSQLLGKPIFDTKYCDLNQCGWANIDAIIDFSLPESLELSAPLLKKYKIPYLCAMTGLNAKHNQIIHELAKDLAVLQTNNTSVGVHILADLVARAAQKLAEYDIEIVEMHHRQKKDSPSGTALLLGQAAASGRGQKLQDVQLPPHDGLSGGRDAQKIGFASLRGGQVIGDHSVILAGRAEMLTLSHRANDRMLFADGAVKIAGWLSSQPAGLYSMQDFINHA